MYKLKNQHQMWLTTHTKKNDKVEDDLKLSYQKRSKKKIIKMSEKKSLCKLWDIMKRYNLRIY